jgi:LacI family transcriptional regulator
MPENSSKPQDDQRATIYDVASRAGVAISTVSRVLNESEDVSDATRSRVLKVIDELQFRPDRTAKTLADEQTRTLAITVPSFITPFHNELLKGIRFCLRDYDFDLLLHDLGSQDPLAELRSFLNRGAVDGLIVADVILDERTTAELKAWRTPVVLIGMQEDGLDSYYWDDVTGARSATEHLLEEGHRRIGFIRVKADVQLQKHRLQGYREALSARDVEYDERLVQHGETEKHGGFSEEAGYEAMQRLLALSPPPTAVFASSDVQAVGAYKALRDAGKSVPEDVAVVGYDDVKTSRFIDLSSVTQYMHDVGEKATRRLLNRLGRANKKRVSKMITPELQVRASSKS